MQNGRRGYSKYDEVETQQLEQLNKFKVINIFTLQSAGKP